MNYSQKIARAFEIADYILLVPAGFGVFFASLLIKDAVWFTMIIYVMFVLGFVQLVGYFKHSRGRLSEKRIRALWISTAIYNGVLLIPALAIIFFFLRESTLGDTSIKESLAWAAIVFGTAFGYLTAVILSIKALRFEKNSQKYL